MITERTIVPDSAMPVTVTGMAMPEFHTKLLAAGPCLFREARIHLPAESGMRKAWSLNKRAFAARGFTMRNRDNAWYLQQWLQKLPDGTTVLTDVGEERLAALDSAPVQQTMSLPAVAVSAPSLTLPELPHGLADKLKGYQVAPAKQIFRALSCGFQEWGYPGAVDFSEVGLGKTYMDLAAAIATGRKIIVLCPVVGESGWRRAFAHFGYEPHFISTYEAVRGGFRSNVATMDAHGAFTWQQANDILIIFDEAQALRHDDTLTVRCCSAAIRQGIPMICASATIALSPLEMRFAGRIVGLHAGGNGWAQFLQQHGCFQKGQGSWTWDRRDHHLVRINNRLFPFRGARVRREDLGDECPETIIRTLPFDVPEAREIESKWRETAEFLSRMARQMSAVQIQAAERKARMAVWQECESALVPYVAERVKRDVKDGKSCAVFMNFNKSREHMARLLGTRAGFYGGQNKAARKHYEAEFQADRQHVLINNLGAGGASVSLHDVRGERQRCAYFFMSDDAIKIAQGLGRVDRVGSQSVSQQFLCYVQGSMTESMVNRTRQKMRRLALINDGQRSEGTRF